MTDEAVREPEENGDLPSEFRDVAKQYGRPMFTMVFNAGISSQATQVLANFATKHRSQHSIHAVRVIADSFNQVSSAYCKQMGWTEEMLAQCDRDIMLAFQGKVQVAGQELILDS